MIKKILIIMIALATVQSISVQAVSLSQKPNVILIMTDDQGYGDLACHGNPVIKTPHLDRLHSESVRFTDFHVNPFCAPTRAALMTGRMSDRTHVRTTIYARNHLNRNETTMAEFFKATGYRTGHFGKWHLGRNYPYRPMDRGFDQWVGHGDGGTGTASDYWGNDKMNDTYWRNGQWEKFNGFCTDIYFDETMKFIEKSKDKPFFVYLATNVPHRPWHVLKEWRKPYEGKGLDDKTVDFFATISRFDENLGRLRKFLTDKKLADNTIIVYLTDNGTSGGYKVFNAGMRRAKGSIYEGGHRVPCFIHWPAGGVDKPVDIDRLANHFDLLPTLIDMCSLKTPTRGHLKFDGKSLVPLIKNPKADFNDRTVFMHSQNVMEKPVKWLNSVVMIAQWRLINGQELYDIKADPGQKKDIAENNPRIVSVLRKHYERHWDELHMAAYPYPRPIIGSRYEEETSLVPDGWIADKDKDHKHHTWNQVHVLVAADNSGFWPVEIAEKGTYQFDVRRWPKELNHPISAELPAAKSADVYLYGNPVQLGKGKAIEADEVELVVGKKTFRKKIGDVDASALFKVKLPAGHTDVRAWLIDEKNNKRGAYYIYAKKIDEKPGVNLFILSGQSNMAGLDPKISFTPTVEAAFGKDNVIVVKDAVGGQPIRRWYKKWKSVEGEQPEANGNLYDRLMGKVKEAIKGRDVKSVTFVWMQGERDAKGGQGAVYEVSMKGLIEQLRTDMGRKDINVVIGRLSDHLMKHSGWVTVREAQVAVATRDARSDWVDTDDLNDKKNTKTGKIIQDLHYTREGYKTLGARFAQKAIDLINKKEAADPIAVVAKGPPNIVVILADDMGIDSVGALNDKSGIPTPHLDKLLRQGMLFRDAHSGSAVCSPTRYGLLTGRYSWRSRLKRGIVGKWQPPLIEEGRLTLPGMLKNAGYNTACIGKWHLGWNWPKKGGGFTTNLKEIDFSQKTQGGPIDRGFDHYFGDDVPNWPPFVWIENDKTQGVPDKHLSFAKHYYSDPGIGIDGWTLEDVLPKITARCVDYVTDHAKKKEPFFLYFPMTSPHTPIAPSKAFKGKSGISDYADLLMETDWCVGEVLKALDDSGVANNTLVIFTADNGTSPKCHFDALRAKDTDLQNHWRGMKADGYEGGHRVPFIVRWPGQIKPRTQSDQTISLVDIMATCADAAGVKLPDTAGEDSVSLMPVLKGACLNEALHEAVICHSVSGVFVVRKGKWKLQYSAGSGGWSLPSDKTATKEGLPKWQLYDLLSDAKETKNLIHDHPEVVKELTLILRGYIEKGRSTSGEPQKNHNDAIWWKELPWGQGQ